MTMSCDNVRSWLSAWIDGERTPLSSEDFERHLAECAECTKAARSLRGFLRTVSSAYVPAPVPSSLEASVRGVVRRRSALRRFAPVAAALGAAAAVALVLFTLLRPAPVQAASLAEAAAWAHEGLASGVLPLDVEGHNAAELSRWLTERVGFKVVLPKLEDSTLVFNGGRLVQLEGGATAAVLSFQRNGEPVSLGIAPRHAAGSPADAPRTELFRNMKFTTRTLRGLSVISWSEGELSYALVSRVPATGRASCVVCHGANSGLKSVEEFHGMR